VFEREETPTRPRQGPMLEKLTTVSRLCRTTCSRLAEEARARILVLKCVDSAALRCRPGGRRWGVHARPPLRPRTYRCLKVHGGQTATGVQTFAGRRTSAHVRGHLDRQEISPCQQEIILVKSDDPRCRCSGFWQGMYGSPIYIVRQAAYERSPTGSAQQVAIGAARRSST